MALPLMTQLLIDRILTCHLRPYTCIYNTRYCQQVLLVKEVEARAMERAGHVPLPSWAFALEVPECPRHCAEGLRGCFI